MNRRAIMLSPFLAYCITFTIALLVYQLDWSGLYPPLSWALILFFVVTFCLSIITAFFFRPFSLLQYQPQVSKVPRYAIWFLTLGYILDFAYSHSIPLLSFANGAISYEELRLEFGVPVFHVILVSYNTLISVFYFHTYLSQKRKTHLLLFIVSLIFPILLVSRITLTFIAVSCFYVYLFSVKQNLAGKLIKVIVAGLLFLFGFGLLGNIRTAGDVTADDIFLTIGDAKDNFRDSWVPKSFFWGYIYISSPIADLQTTLDKTPIANNPDAGYKSLFVHEYLWDAVSKRYDESNNTTRTSFTQINDAFNVGTVFARPYVYAGYSGMYFMYFFIWLLSCLFLPSLNAQSKFHLTYVCIFNATVVLCVFDNMFTFTPFGLIVIYPFLERIIAFFGNKRNIGNMPQPSAIANT